MSPARRLAALAALAGLAQLLSLSRHDGASPAAWTHLPPTRRNILSAAGLLAGTGLRPNDGFVGVEPALASGGSTAGKYSTIPSAKRRFYGRVRQGIYQFLSMEAPIKAGKFDDPVIDDFFGMNIVKVKGGQDIKACAFSECKTKEKRTSRWLDFKISSDLLASAFRYDASDVNDYLPQVRLIRAYAKKIEKLQAAIASGDQQQAASLYQKAKLDLSRYVPMVELQALDSEDYTHEWDTRPEVVCQGNFCV